MSKSISVIYGIVNVSLDEFQPPTNKFFVSNIHQIPKILKNTTSPIIVALCVVPKVNGYKEGKIAELVEVVDFASKTAQQTTGAGYAVCNSIFTFGNSAKTRDFFNIRPHSQRLIKKLREEDSLSILKYYKELQHA